MKVKTSKQVATPPPLPPTPVNIPQQTGSQGQQSSPPANLVKTYKQEIGLSILILLLAFCFFYFLLPWMKNKGTSALPKVLEVQAGQSPLPAPSTGSNGTTYYIVDPKVLAELISTNVAGGIHITQIATQTVDGQRANGSNTTNTTAPSTTTTNSQQVEKQPVNVEIHELANCGSFYEFEVPDEQNVRWDQTEGSKMIVYVDGFTYTGTATAFQTGKKIKFVSQTTFPFKIRLRFYEK
ncbi:MAG: hypothetical protein NUV47_00655 [Patescibacteria group bacterium]|nr:hypothetical protein [Patescibacteria group bacterium]